MRAESSRGGIPPTSFNLKFPLSVISLIATVSTATSHMPGDDGDSSISFSLSTEKMEKCNLLQLSDNNLLELCEEIGHECADVYEFRRLYSEMCFTIYAKERHIGVQCRIEW